MGDFPHQFLPQAGSGVGNRNMVPQDVHPSQIPGVGVPVSSPTVPAAFSGMSYFTAFHDPMMFSVPKTQSSSQRSRRKSTSGGLDTVKHRRTRSGCFMCRSRRVKCDETRPICERCKKGNRECIYPDLPSSKPPATQGSARDATSFQQVTSPGSSTGADEAEYEMDNKLETIADEDEEYEGSEQHGTVFSGQTSTTSPSFSKSSTRQSSETPSFEGSKDSPLGSTGSSSATPNLYQPFDPAFQSTSARPNWSHLPFDYQYYLNSFCENMTHYHYCFSTDADRFFTAILPNVAVRYEPLLNAVVGFAAYHETLQKPDGKVEDFLKYYNKSVVLLLNSLQRKEQQTIATLLTVLQLSTIEEYLGDWINILGHQKAALQMLTNLFPTPETAMQSPMGRMTFTWYSRYDAFVAVMGGFPTAVPRDWFVAFVEKSQEKIAQAPGDIERRLEEAEARLRLISVDMSYLYPKGHRGEITPEEFSAEHDRIASQLKQWRETLDPAITNPAYLANEFPNRKELGEGDIVNPYAPGILYREPLFAMTLMTAQYHSITVMHESQSTTARKDLMYASLREHSFMICQIFEAVERWPESPRGALVLVQACLAISALFLPQDAKHHYWVRQKFALMETLGYIHPLTLRSKMGELFREPSCVRWWLPNDEGFTPILQSIRAFADERNAVAVSAQVGNLREVNQVFAKLQLGE